MSPLIAILIMCAVCYLLGSVPFGFLVGRAKGVDIRQEGSRNIGATNVGRVLGRKFGIAVFVLDVAKGLVPVLFCGRLLSQHGMEWGVEGWLGNLVWLLAGASCVLGHNYSVYLGFKGGKGVATTLGVVLGVYPQLTLPGLAAFVIWAVVVLIWRYVSLGSITAAIVFPLVFVGYGIMNDRELFGGELPLLVFSVVMAGLVVYRHRENIGRLRAGTENRIGGRRETNLPS